MADKHGDGNDEGAVVRLTRRPRVPASRKAGPASVLRRLGVENPDHLPTLHQPFSPVTEQFRMLSVRLQGDLAPTAGGGRVIAFTSALPAEGKTCCSLNTAIIAAKDINRRVVFVECDLRAPNVADLVDGPVSVGVAEILAGKAQLHEAIFPVEAPRNLRMVLAGKPPANPVELLGSRQMGVLIQELRRSYDLIVLDTPPARDFADASKLAAFVDGFLLVVRSGQTPRDALSGVHRQLERYGILGVILNDAPAERRSRYYDRYYRKGPGRDSEEI